MNQGLDQAMSPRGALPVRSATMPVRSGERLRWGLTGLAAVFLLVMIAAAGLQPADRSERPGAGESLAVLGVAPGPGARQAGD